MKRPIPAVVAGLALIITAVAAAGAPAAVASAPPPTHASSPTSTSSTTTTTPSSTTTTTRPPPTTATTATVTPALPAPGSSVVPQLVPGALTSRGNGPPDVNVLLPSDSLTAAQIELDALMLERQRDATEDGALGAAMAADSARLSAARQELDALAQRRRKRAALLYRDLADTVSVTKLLLESSINPEDENVRRLELATATDRGEQRRTRNAERAVRDLESRISKEQRRRDELAKQTAVTDARIAGVTDKLTAAIAAISLVGPQLPALPGPSALALAARDTELALTTADLAQQTSAIATYRAAAAHADPVLGQAAATASTDAAVAQAAYTHRRVALAHLVGQALHGDGAPLDAIWAATPSPALRAVLFALSQVGKPYVYATAGPDTYDCSGLTKRAWAESGIGLPHFSGAQLHAGLPVAVPALRPGDLLTYGPDGSEHVVLFVGNGWVVQAEGSSFGVVITPAELDPLHGFAGASRPIP